MLLACGYVGAFGTSKMVHEFIKSIRFEIDLKFEIAFVDMYAKCRDMNNSLILNAKDKTNGWENEAEQLFYCFASFP